MDDFKQLLQGIYKMMLDVQVPVLGYVFSLWQIFLYGFIGAFVVWFLHKYFD